MFHLPPLIQDLALILTTGAAISILFRVLKQPPVLGYIVAGCMVGPHVTLLPTISDLKSVQVWAEIGVIFLLFGLGLEFSFRKLWNIGGSASITAIFEILSMLGLGYLAGRALGWSSMDSIYLGGILSISSTTIIVRAFDEMNVKGKKFASLVFGVLIVEDLAAIVLLVLLSTVAVSRELEGASVALAMFKLSFFLVLWFVLGIFALPTLLRKFRKHLSEELVIVVALGLCFLMVILATSAGFSPALGAFIMGSILAETSDGERIAHLIQPVKDLFAVVFFVSVGMLIDPKILIQYAGPIALIAGLTLIGKTISTTLGALLAGQNLRCAMQTGFSLGQIGEFSFIIATLGLSLGVTSDFLYPIAVAVSAISVFCTPYMIRAADPTYEWIERHLPGRWKETILRYGSATQRISSETKWKGFLVSQLITLGVNTILIVSFSGWMMRGIYPWAANQWGNSLGLRYGALLILLAVVSPFLWAIGFGAIKYIQPDSKSNSVFYRLPLGLVRTLRVIHCVMLLLVITSRLVSPLASLLITLVMVFIYMQFSGYGLQRTYLRARDQFMGNLAEGRATHDSRQDSGVPLAPWDAHIVSVIVPPESKAIGETISDLKIRERFGVTIALIKRGKNQITAPGRHERLFPHDEIFVIGTDEQLISFRSFLEKEASAATQEASPYKLHSLILSEKSPFIQKPIRSSGLREAVAGLIVGIERNGQRILNPDSTYELQAGDLLWIVGDVLKMKELQA